MEHEDAAHERHASDKHWHLEKTVSVGHIITTLTVAGSMLIWAMSINTRVTVLEAESVHSQQADNRIEVEMKESVTRIEAAVVMKESVTRIEAAVVRMEALIQQKADKR